MIFAEQIFGGVQIRRSQKKLMLIHVCNQNPFTLIFRYYYSIEELGGREGGGGGGRTKPRPKCVEKPSAARFAHPLRGAEVLVAVRGPSPGEGGGKNSPLDTSRLKRQILPPSQEERLISQRRQLQH